MSGNPMPSRVSRLASRPHSPGVNRSRKPTTATTKSRNCISTTPLSVDWSRTTRSMSRTATVSGTSCPFRSVCVASTSCDISTLPTRTKTVPSRMPTHSRTTNAIQPISSSSRRHIFPITSARVTSCSSTIPVASIGRVATRSTRVLTSPIQRISRTVIRICCRPTPRRSSSITSRPGSGTHSPQACSGATETVSYRTSSTWTVTS